MKKNERTEFRYQNLELRGAEMDDMTITGAAAVMGNMDSYGDVIFPGAFSKAVLSEFLKTGFIPDTHDWGSMGRMVAMPISAKQVGRELVCAGKFHSTEYAQEVRTVCAERIEHGLAVGLSIGFMIDYSDTDSRMWFENSASMLKYIKDTKLDESAFDIPSIKAWGDRSCRAVFRVSRLREWSPVPTPANGQANATAVKQFASDLGLLAGLSLDDHSNSVLAAVRGLTQRMEGLKALREGEGRSLSDARRSEIEELKGLIEGLLTSTEREEPADRGAALRDLQRAALARRRDVLALQG